MGGVEARGKWSGLARWCLLNCCWWLFVSIEVHLRSFLSFSLLSFFWLVLFALSPFGEEKKNSSLSLQVPFKPFHVARSFLFPLSVPGLLATQ